MLINGAAAAGRLQPRRLLDIGFPTTPDPIVLFTILGILTLLIGASVLRVVEHRIGGHTARRDYAVVLFAGLAIPLTRLIATVWVNARVPSNTRATVHSFLSRAEYLGVITLGALIAGLAKLTSLPIALVGCAALFTLTATIVGRPAQRPR